MITWNAGAAGRALAIPRLPPQNPTGLFCHDEPMTLGHLLLGSGARTAIVLHEWLGDASNYEPLHPYLDLAARRYCFADLRGYGRSLDLAGEYSLAEACADVLALADRLGLARFDLVGHSMSGLVAQRLALVAPARVRAVVAITPVFAAGFPADAASLRRMTAVATEDAAARAAIADRTGGRYGPAWLDFKLRKSRERSTEAARLGYLRMFTQTDFAAEAQGNPLRLLVISGQHDLPLYREDAARRSFGACYPHCEFALAEGAGHYPMLETPIFVAAQIDAFLARGGA